MATGWVKYRETWYFMEEKDGYMLSKQFIKSGDGWYYLKANGELHTEPDGLITVVDTLKEN
ncbi:lytic amidase [Streptococcus pneumoniae]|nr:lytic amidase [Streptococcus pneumoniae]